MFMKSSDIIIYTDGSSRENLGPGGWGAVLTWGNDKLKVEVDKQVYFIYNEKRNF